MKKLSVDQFEKGIPTIAITGPSVYTLAGGRNASPEQRAEMGNPDHPKRLNWEKALSESLGQMSKDTRVLVVPDGLGLNAARAALNAGLQVVLVRDHALHHFGRLERGGRNEQGELVPSAEMELYRELTDRASGVIDVGQAPQAMNREYFLNERPKHEEARATVVAELADRLISANPYRNPSPEEAAFEKAGKEVEKRPTDAVKEAAGIGFWTLGLPSYKRDAETVILAPAEENDLTQWNRTKNTTVLQAGDKVALKNIGSENFPRPNQLAQASTLMALNTLLTDNMQPPETVEELGNILNRTSLTVQTMGEDGEVKPKKFDKINREMALVIFAQARESGANDIMEIAEKMREIIATHKFMGAAELGQFTIQERETLSAQDLADKLNQNPESYKLPEELKLAFRGHDGQISAERIASYSMALMGKNKPNREDLNQASQLIKEATNAVANEEEWEPAISESLRQTILDSVEQESRLGLAVKQANEELQDIPEREKQQRNEATHRLNHLNEQLQEARQNNLQRVAMGLNSPSKVQVNVLQAKRTNEPVEGKTSPELLARMGLTENELYAAEARAWVENTMTHGRTGGSTITLTMQALYKPAVDQELHPDGYRAEENPVLDTNVQIKNVPASALPALRCGDLAPNVHTVCYVPNLLRALAENNHRIQHTGDREVTTLEFKDNNLQEQTHVVQGVTIRANIGSIAKGVFSVTDHDLERATSNNIGIAAIRRGQEQAYVVDQTEPDCNLSRNTKTKQIDELGNNGVVKSQRPLGPDVVPTTVVNRERLNAIATGLGGQKDEVTANRKIVAALDGILQGDRESTRTALATQPAQVVNHPALVTQVSLNTVTESLRSSGQNHISLIIGEMQEREAGLKRMNNQRDSLGNKMVSAESLLNKEEMDEIRGIARNLNTFVKETLANAPEGLVKAVNDQRNLGDKVAILTGTALKREIPALQVANPMTQEETRKVANNIVKRSEGAEVDKNIERVAGILYGAKVREAEAEVENYRQNGANADAMKLAQEKLEKAKQPYEKYKTKANDQARSMQVLAGGTIEESRQWGSPAMLKEIGRMVYQEEVKQKSPENFNETPMKKVFEQLDPELHGPAKQMVDNILKHAKTREVEPQHLNRAIAYSLGMLHDGERIVEITEGLAKIEAKDISIKRNLAVGKTQTGQNYLLNGMNRIIEKSRDGQVHEPTKNVTESEEIAQMILRQVQTTNVARESLEAGNTRRLLLGSVKPTPGQRTVTVSAERTADRAGKTAVRLEEAGFHPEIKQTEAGIKIEVPETEAGEAVKHLKQSTINNYNSDLKPNEVVVLVPENHPSTLIETRIRMAKGAEAVVGKVAAVEKFGARRKVTLEDGRVITGPADKIQAKEGEEIQINAQKGQNGYRVAEEPSYGLSSTLPSVRASAQWLFDQIRERTQQQTQEQEKAAPALTR